MREGLSSSSLYSLSDESPFEVSKSDVVFDSGRTDHMMIYKPWSWFKNYEKLDITVTIQMEHKQKLNEWEM